MTLTETLSPFVGLFFGVCLMGTIFKLIAHLAGWPKFVARYPAVPDPPKPTVVMGYAVFNGVVGYNGAMMLGTDERGLHIRTWPVLSWFHDPVMIPWSEIAEVGQRKRFWLKQNVIVLKSLREVDFALRASTFEKLRPAFEKARVPVPAR